MNPRVVTFHYTLKDKEGNLIDTSEGSHPLSYLEGTGQIITGLEDEIKGLNAGDKRVISVDADKAYGPKDPEKVFDVPKSQFPEGEVLSVGMMFQTDEPDVVYTITEIKGETIIVDGNHPLAGVDLIFDVQIVTTRTATDEEVSHGHVHGEGGHHHH
ncbi:peptidylprolyl isomerase [Leptospira wolffii]|uniref:Peptidyl-prolyl cis-trans isomerase n=1 Tax=Leptospira wolffii TaxID=409998 RepID=A0A2M9Z9Q6_9LEPT|nr:peptidylprolyl isomerase [Leptospira wolffii]EPG66647.1 peptidyl-prolyl cis-trans isomerase, FKBP-type [Leptospira wolffii serovar Khorat str. Khorat-H2]PJZ65092.1 peptidylprolyl isomerase [Leptospira wolffii]TGK56781.1 peptidylprolyl isomerase [Leptospira wolffii]TGK71637.1 peptidylprolyl isomerase [Leptospira wolffii]TGK75506.1 peptidylprolyl isomerase [Leptospira wolffii]